MKRAWARRLLPLAAIAVLLITPTTALLLVPAPNHPVSPTVRPATSAGPVIISSALPAIFSNRTFAYAIVSSIPVNWTCVRCYDATLIGGPLSTVAGLHGTAPFNASATGITYSVQATCSTGTTYQNWTSKVLTVPVITSTPSFYDSPGVNYTYIPTLANPGTGGHWNFTGAPWFTFEPTTGALYGASPGTASYVNVLSYTSTNGSWSQAWYTTQFLNTVPPFISTGMALGPPYVQVNFPTSDVAGYGAGYIWLGQYPLLQVNKTFLGTYVLSTDGAYNETLTTGQTGTTAVTLYYYWAPGSSPPIMVNGVAHNLGAFPSSGFLTEGVGTIPPNPGHGTGPLPTQPPNQTGKVPPILHAPFFTVQLWQLLVLGASASLIGLVLFFRRRGWK